MSNYTFPQSPRSPLAPHNLPIRSSPSPLRHSTSAYLANERRDAANTGLPDENEVDASGRRQSKFSARRDLFDSPTSPDLNAAPLRPMRKDTHRSTEPLRSALRPLSEAPNGHARHARSQSHDVRFMEEDEASPSSKMRPHSQLISRADSIRAPARSRIDRSSGQFVSQPDLSDPTKLQGLQRSTTGHLRTLGKYAESNNEDDFAIKAPEQEVVGMHGRRRLQRGMTTKKKGAEVSKYTSGWQSSRWMDQQRQFLQAYEYLCHIGEAKEWIEDVVQKQIPPIVELEEALRDGVTLAEVVQALFPERHVRIFRNDKLQFRHSDNIALFFRFLAEMDLPELFRFELVDLYEKKNIPKVIYCIHALSWLLFRKGVVDFRIGNLVGQLQFEDHELEATQKGLDKAGVSMPNFSGMSANFDIEPEEPAETEDERIDRELGAHELAIEELQSQARGAIIRLSLGDTMQQLWDSEPQLIRLQSMVRGDMARQIAQYRLDMRLFAVRLQAASRGFLTRARRQSKARHWQDHEHLIVAVQSRWRSRQAQKETSTLRSNFREHDAGIRDIQAAMRGALARWRVGDQYHETREAASRVEDLQAAVRGALARKVVESQLLTLQESAHTISQVQAMVRGHLTRKDLGDKREFLDQQYDLAVDLQRLIRGVAARRRVCSTMAQVRGVSSDVTSLQSSIRGFLGRQRYARDLTSLHGEVESITLLQSFARAYLNRQSTYDVLCELNEAESSIVMFQSLLRTTLLHQEIGDTLEQLSEEEGAICELQSAMRAFLVRRKFVEKKRFYKENMEKVIKIQSFVRAKQQGEAYKSLTTGKNPPVGTVKNFVHLLNDSGFDFDEELEFERLRKTVSQHVRQNEMAEQYIDQLDIKIALLVKNKITLDEVVRHQKQFGGHVGSLLNNKELSSKDPFDLRALNKNSRKKLEHYQELFFLLQTQPQYLARLFKRFREQGMPERESKRIEILVMGMFGFAQKRREEYYLLRVIAQSMKEEIEACNNLQEHLRGSFFWHRILTAYARSPRDRKYMKDAFGPMVRESILEPEGLDLESDPLQIYRAAINNEELRTGQRSMRNPEVPREEAIRDPETRDLFIAHLQDLRDISDHCFALLEETLPRMPYGIRYIAQQQFLVLRQSFPQEDELQLLQICGSWLWKNYLLPALTQPEMWGVIDRGLNPAQKRNISEVAKVVGQCFSGRPFGGENVYLQPLNTWVAESIDRLSDFLGQLMNIQDVDSHFDIDEFNDLFAKNKPTLYIKMADIFSIHHLIADSMQMLSSGPHDPLNQTIKELGSAKSNESEMMGVSSQEISLQLNPRYHNTQDPDAELKSLFMETKRLVLYIIRVQSGANLLDILVKPITEEDDEKWLSVLDEEYSQQNDINRRKSGYAASVVSAPSGSASLDVTVLTYAELKSSCLENVLALERHGRVSRQNQYQDILNAIAIDIRTKHRRRQQRARELDGVRATLAQLDTKAAFLDEQLQSYNDYVEQAMVTLQNKKGKKRFLMPFTRQYNHEKELARSGRTPKFGSFKYSARQLAEKGVLVSWTGYTEDKWSRVNITISSDEVGVFHIEGSTSSTMIPGASASVPLDDLLQAQFENSQFIHLFPDGGLKFNVNLFLNLVYKKFFD